MLFYFQYKSTQYSQALKLLRNKFCNKSFYAWFPSEDLPLHLIEIVWKILQMSRRKTENAFKVLCSQKFMKQNKQPRHQCVHESDFYICILWFSIIVFILMQSIYYSLSHNLFYCHLKLIQPRKLLRTPSIFKNSHKNIKKLNHVFNGQ